MYHLKRKAEHKTVTWAGGTTTQLAIHPETAEYQKFNFDYRISYATVEVPESTFTFMPGVTRNLMILKGELEIDHIDRYKKQLKKFDVDVFSGEWPTKAKGQVMDFNLMTRGQRNGTLSSLTLSKSVTEELKFNTGTIYNSIYLLKGEINVIINGETVMMNEGDYIGMEALVSKCNIIAKQDTELVISAVS
jgi:uncharacterized protein